MKGNKRENHSNPVCLQVCVELRYELSQALLKKDEAERELRDVSTRAGRQIEKATQVGGRFMRAIQQPESSVPESLLLEFLMFKVILH